jgi:Protein of unknown function (DUF3015)
MKHIIKALFLAGAVSTMSACTVTDFLSSTSSTLDAATPDIGMNQFIDKRYNAIRKDAATGGGENIEALAQIMGERDSKAFASWMQANYDQLFTEAKDKTALLAKLEQYGQPDKG